MIPKKTSLFCLLVMLSAVSLPASAKNRSCVDWPRVMAQYQLDRMSTGKTVLVESFSDFTKQPGDEWLTFGIRDLLTGLLRTSPALRVLSGNTAEHSTLAGAVDIRISGSFQHMTGARRVFISVRNENTGSLEKQLEASFSYPENMEFFAGIANAAQEIIKAAGARPDSGALSRIQNATNSTRAYESYAKGRQAFETYSPAKAEVASTWFTDAKRLDYKSRLGYKGLIDLYTFLGFYHKQMGEPFNIWFQKAEEETNLMKKFTGIQAIRDKGVIENRFLAGNAAYTEGLMAEQRSDWLGASAAFRRSTDSVPEDAVSWYHLARAEVANGNQAAADAAMAKARAINTCLE